MESINDISTVSEERTVSSEEAANMAVQNEYFSQEAKGCVNELIEAFNGIKQYIE